MDTLDRNPRKHRYFLIICLSMMVFNQGHHHGHIEDRKHHQTDLVVLFYLDLISNRYIKSRIAMFLHSDNASMICALSVSSVSMAEFLS